MARERYLVGVSEEELRYKPSEKGPKTPKEKWQNIWYHYKWPILAGVFAAFVVTVLVVQSVTRVKPDYRICMATSTYIPQEIVQQLQTELAACGKDVNGDGKIEVQIQALNVETNDRYTKVGSTNRQAVMSRLVAWDVLTFAFSKSYYETLSSNFGDEFSFFETVESKPELLNEEQTAFVLDLTDYFKAAYPTYSDEKIKELFPENILIGVRLLPEDANDKKRAEQQQCAELLNAYFT